MAEVFSVFREVIEQYKELKSENEQQKRFLTVLVDQLTVGVVAYEEQGKIMDDDP